LETNDIQFSKNYFDIIIIIIIIIIISFMQGIYTYIPETNNVPKEYNVTAILSLLCMVPISLVRVLTLQCTFTLALSEVCAQCGIWQFSVVPQRHDFFFLLLLLFTAVDISPGGNSTNRNKYP
jgi:hypothetical protein